MPQNGWHKQEAQFVSHLGDTASRSGTAEVTGAVYAQNTALPVKIGELCSGTHAHTPTHQHTPCTLLRVLGTAALRCSPCTPRPTSSSSQHHVPTQAAGPPPPCCTHTLLRGDPHAPAPHPLTPVPPCQHCEVHLRPVHESPWGKTAVDQLLTPTGLTPQPLRPQRHLP